MKRTYIKKVQQQKEFSKMFGQMSGVEDCDPQIIAPKYERLYKTFETILEILSNFCSSNHYKVFYKQFGAALIELKVWVESSTILLKKTYLEPQEPTEAAGLLDQTYHYDPKKLNTQYRKLKTSKLSSDITSTLDTLLEVLKAEKERSKSKITNLDVNMCLSDNFITNSDGHVLKLFSFSKLDFKLIQSHPNYKPFKKYMLLMLHIIYRSSIEVYEILVSPDVDIDKVSKVIIDSLLKLKKKIRDCDEAFKKIENGVRLLKGNFANYYKDFVKTGDNSIIIGSFLSDVIKKTKGNVKVATQFKKIVSFIQKESQKQGKMDKTGSKMFSFLNSQIDLLSKKEDK
jgi:hypothetical protein